MPIVTKKRKQVPTKKTAISCAESLQSKAAATVKESSSAKELAEKVIDQKKSRKDFSSAYIETKAKDLKLQADRLEWEKENRVNERKEET